ncbi:MULTISPECIES: hypothetical protein [Sphingobacterium]|uniref:Uncharacterized protein n=1 Tax=Sphingobacterium populi TaxID=1812824 RepID=A0ABW5U9T0_9SPHI|nr:hypothetical protein [Sphingobacterium sp. CFCC 11742]
MIEESEKIIDHYLANNKIAATLESEDLALLKKMLYGFVKVKGDLISTSTLLAYCSQVLTSKKSFTRDLAKVCNKALEIILEKS